jgi:hypothetical protein
MVPGAGIEHYSQPLISGSRRQHENALIVVPVLQQSAFANVDKTG